MLKPYYVYVLRCTGGSLYTGIAADVQRRFSEHKEGRGAKYTRSHKPIAIVAAWVCASRSDALKAEYAFKHLSKSAKEEVISSPDKLADYIEPDYVAVSCTDIQAE